MRWQCEGYMEIGKCRLGSCKEKIPTHAAHEWGTQMGIRGRSPALAVLSCARADFLRGHNARSNQKSLALSIVEQVTS